MSNGDFELAKTLIDRGAKYECLEKGAPVGVTIHNIPALGGHRSGNYGSSGSMLMGIADNFGDHYGTDSSQMDTSHHDYGGFDCGGFDCGF